MNTSTSDTPCYWV